MAKIEEASKNWKRRKSIKENNHEEQKFKRRIQEEKEIEEMNMCFKNQAE